MSGYNDDLVMSYAMGLWIRETALRLRAEGIELQKKAISSITSNQGVYTPTDNKDKNRKRAHKQLIKKEIQPREDKKRNLKKKIW